jgi:hypothetical protein
MTSPSATQDSYPYQNEPIWSRSEKTVARAAFDAALKRELQEIMQEAKQMANQANEPADLWDLEHHLTQRRKEIDRGVPCRPWTNSTRVSALVSRKLTTKIKIFPSREEQWPDVRPCRYHVASRTMSRGEETVSASLRPIGG